MSKENTVKADGVGPSASASPSPAPTVVVAAGSATGAATTGQATPATPAAPASVPSPRVAFEPSGETERVLVADEQGTQTHVGTITKQPGKTPTFFPTVHVFITLADLKAVIARMEA